MAHHRIYIDTPGTLQKGELTITGEEARHAIRIKRIQTRDAVELLDGQGGVADAIVVGTGRQGRHGWALTVEITGVRSVVPGRPRLEVYSAVPKGPRLEDMIDGLSQVGAAAWGPLETRRSVVEPREGKLERMARVAAESAKQCGRAWVMEIMPGLTLEGVLRKGAGTTVMADATGIAYGACAQEAIRVLVGPEGGWTSEEIAGARNAGARVTRFGAHAMRIETAAVVAAGVILGAEMTGSP